MSCPTKNEILEVLNGAENPELSSHLQTCPECGGFLETVQSTVDLLSRTGLSVPSGECLDVNQVAGYLHRALPQTEMEAVEAHLSACPKCLDEIAAMPELLEEVPPPVPAVLERRVRDLAPANGCPGREVLFGMIHEGPPSGEVAAHVESCASCGRLHREMSAVVHLVSTTPPAGAPGNCPDESLMAAYLRRGLSREKMLDVEEHVASCSECLDEVVHLSEILDAAAAEVPENLERRVLELGGVTAFAPRAARRGTRAIRTARAKVHRFRRNAVAIPIAVAAAAVVLIAVVVAVLSSGETPPPADVVVKPEDEVPAPMPVVKKVVDPRPKPEPKAPEAEPERFVREEPKPETKSDAVARVEPRPEPNPEKVEPKPEPEAKLARDEKPDEKVETKVGRPELVGVAVRPVAGDLFLRRGGSPVPVGEETVIAAEQELFAGARGHASFETDEGRITLRRQSALRVSRTASGDVKIALLRGEGYFVVEKKKRSFVVCTPAADAVVTGTSFGVEVKDRSTLLTVEEGRVQFRNQQGTVEVDASHSSRATEGRGPSAPAPMRPEAISARIGWAQRPDLQADNTNREYMEIVYGGNRANRGVVLVAPYCEREEGVARLGRAMARGENLPLVVGHHYRDTVDKKIWFNIDRASEGKVVNGRVPLYEVTDRSKAVFLEYMASLREAGGLRANELVPFIANLREHKSLSGSERLWVCEVANKGIPAGTLKRARDLANRLVEEKAPSRRIEFRFQSIDASYMYQGKRRAYYHTDLVRARSLGYMSNRASRRAVGMFFPAGMFGEEQDVAKYAEIVWALLEYLARN